MIRCRIGAPLRITWVTTIQDGGEELSCLALC
jgi:hypothetical protein